MRHDFTQFSVSDRAAAMQALRSHPDIVDWASRQLAMNFDVSAAQIIGIACGKLGISRSAWDALQHLKIASKRTCLSCAHVANVSPGCKQWACAQCGLIQSVSEVCCNA